MVPKAVLIPELSCCNDIAGELPYPCARQPRDAPTVCVDYMSFELTMPVRLTGPTCSPVRIFAIIYGRRENILWCIAVSNPSKLLRDDSSLAFCHQR
jgi:hypothetical protein